MSAVEKQVLIACIGNLFLGDDGFGVEAARALATADLPSDVVVIDYGIRGLDLAYALLEPWRAVIFVDAVARGGEPGSLYCLAPDTDASAPAGLNPHAMDPAQVLALARSLGEIRAPLTLLGCEPQDLGDELEGRIGLSPPVAAAVPRCVAAIHDLINQWTTCGALSTTR